MYFIKTITTEETYTVRQPVLRAGKPVEACIFEDDNLLTTTHFGIYNGDAIAGCVSVFAAANACFAEETQFQLRGMAVLENYRKLGLGILLIVAAEEHIKERHGHIIWFNARENAVGFYKNRGYHISGGPFAIAGIGLHYVMFRVME